MFKFLSLTALASVVVLTTAAVTPVSAMRLGGGGGGGGGHYHFSQHFNGGRFSGRPHYFNHNSRYGHYHHFHHFHWRHGSYGWAYGVPVGVGVGVATYAAAAPAPVCTCLTKDYLEDGAVRFTDTCTRETAISMPAPPAPRN